MIEFRKARPSDALTIAKIRHIAFDATYRGIFSDETIDLFDEHWHEEKQKTRLRNPNYQCYLVMDGKTCVGYFAYGKVCPGTWKDFNFRLHALYLTPEYQGRGLARRIFETVRTECLSKGYNRLFLDCHPENYGGLAFYKHMGGIVTDVDYGTGSPEEFGCTLEFYFS